jgi:ABC-type Fe3+-hydroxamate transport system substrate-binding protein
MMLKEMIEEREMLENRLESAMEMAEAWGEYCTAEGLENYYEAQIEYLQERIQEVDDMIIYYKEMM